MYVDTASYLNTLQPQDDSSSSTDMGKDEFLQILVAQLENQDPLNPMEDTEMVSQLADFSSLEQLTNISESMTSTADLIARQTAISAVSYLGKDVYATGNSLSKTEDSVSNAIYDLNDDAQNVIVNIYNESGNIVDSEELGSMSSGEHTFSWDGLNSDGSEADDGVYYVSFAAEDANGAPIDLSTYVSGKVTGTNTESGNVMLQLEGGREVNMLNVYQVSEYATQ